MSSEMSQARSAVGSRPKATRFQKFSTSQKNSKKNKTT
jgi:hypothetical protein